MTATAPHYDVAILGTGFAGTILGAILTKLGARVVLVDAGTHPRFAVGESTIPHTSLLLSILAERFGIPEIDHVAYPDRLARHVGPTSGIKRSFGFAYHRPGEPHDPTEGHQFGTTSKDENHFFRQDVDAYLLHVAIRYGATARFDTRVTGVEIDAGGVRLAVDHGEPVTARYVVDGTGYRSALADAFGLRESPTRLTHHSRSLFTHMLDVRPFDEVTENPLILPWHKSTLHHVFEGGWFWVIPFDNHDASTNPLTSVGLTVDPRVHGDADPDPAREFQRALQRFPSVAPQFAHAKPVRPWVSTRRLQYSSTRSVGYRYCLMSHAAGFVDPLFSRGMINSIEILGALVDPLMQALDADDFSEDAFAPVEALSQRVLDYNDRLVGGAYASWSDFDLWNAWLRVWALGTIVAEFRVMNALTDFTLSRDPTVLDGEARAPAFSVFEDPDYAGFFDGACGTMEAFAGRALGASEAAEAIFAHAERYEMPVLLRRDAMRRAGWLSEHEALSDRNIRFACEGYRWALGNPTTRDLFGTSETLYRWRARWPDPHVALPEGASRVS